MTAKQRLLCIMVGAWGEPSRVISDNRGLIAEFEWGTWVASGREIQQNAGKRQVIALIEARKAAWSHLNRKERAYRRRAFFGVSA
jgi:hypothetical protein